MVLRCEYGEHLAEGEPRIDVGVKEDDRLPRSIASFGIVECHVRREVDLSELHSIGLAHRFPPSRPAFPTSPKGVLLTMHDATRRNPAHLVEAYSPECVEGKFCEVRPRFYGILR